MSQLLEQLQLLTGQVSHLSDTFDRSISIERYEHGDIGASQFKELLLTAGFDLIDGDFFAFLCSGIPCEYKDEMKIAGLEELKSVIDRFRKIAAFKYGSFKYGFNRLALMTTEEIREELADVLPLREGYFSKRTISIEEISPIPPQDRYLLGYISGEEELSSEVRERIAEIKELGRANLRKYLTYDHIDVYVATSMRKKGDYVSVAEFVENVFDHQPLKDMKIRHFDPTQSYSEDRFCKGLVESLMLKRAKCAIYCAQEMDTFGKDSELAVTLAQGKPVLVYVPDLNDPKESEKYAQRLIRDSKIEAPENPIKALRLALVSNFPKTVLDDSQLLLIDDIDTLTTRLVFLFKTRYDDKAKMFQNTHPLSLQVNLATGVAHGILLVRNADQCSELLDKVLNRRLEFDIDSYPPLEPAYALGDYPMTYVLIEKTTKSPYRVVIGDEHLTNAFWNLYLYGQQTRPPMLAL